MGIIERSLANLSHNKYASVMKEIARGLFGWSSVLMLVFVIYQITANVNAYLFSLKSLVVVVIGEIVFGLLSFIANILVMAIIMPVVVPFMLRDKCVIAQNIHTTMLAIFSLSLCMFSWFFASFVVDYAYSGPRY